jgi:hypothetical protein
MQVVSGPIVVMAHNLQAALIQALVYYGPGLLECLVVAARGARSSCSRLAGRTRSACACPCAGMGSRKASPASRPAAHQGPRPQADTGFPAPTAPPSAAGPPLPSDSDGEERPERDIILAVT